MRGGAPAAHDTLVAKSLPPSSSLFHEANKVRERGGVWGNALQPVM